MTRGYGRLAISFVPLTMPVVLIQVVQEAETLLSFAHSVTLRAASRTAADDE